MAASPLLEIPAELRVRIYELALTFPHPIAVHESPSRHELHPSNSAFLSRAQALTRTCKQIHQECGATFYTHNDFIFNFSAFLANVILIRHFGPRIDAANDHGPLSLQIKLPTPMKQFNINARPNRVAANQSRAILYRLCSNLHRFQNQHPPTTVTLHLPIQLKDVTEDSHLDLELTFIDEQGSIDAAIALLQDMLNDDAGSQYFALYISELLELRKQRLRANHSGPQQLTSLPNLSMSTLSLC